MQTTTPQAPSLRALSLLTTFALSTVLTVSSAFAQTSASGPVSGPGTDPRQALDRRTYTPVTVYKLKRPKVVWKLREAFHGLDDERMDSLLIDCCAYVKPSNNLSANAVDLTHSLELEADKYGGPGMNGNYGSGRAASRTAPILGEVQIKGVGQTDMVNVIKRDQQHSSGFLYYEDALIEAAWSVIANAEAPWGANRVLGIIDTGAEFTSDGINWEPAVIIVREDPMRPAHFIINTNIDADDRLRKHLDEARTEGNLDRLAALLPASRQASERTLASGLWEYATRLGEQYSYLFANRIHHGATTPSNIGVRGELLDLATQAALGGYQKSMAVDLLPFGDPNIAVEYILRQFWDAAEPRLTARDRRDLPSFQSLIEVYMNSYRSNEAFEFLKLLGLDARESQLLRDTPAAKELVTTLEALIDHLYPDRQKTYLGTPTDAGPVSVSKALVSMAQAPLSSKQETLRSLEALGVPSNFAANLANSTRILYAKAREDARGVGSPSSLIDFQQKILQAAQERNAERPGVSRTRETSEMRKEIARAYRTHREPEIVQNFVDNLIKNNLRNPREIEAPKSVSTNHLPASSCRTVVK